MNQKTFPAEMPRQKTIPVRIMLYLFILLPVTGTLSLNAQNKPASDVGNYTVTSIGNSLPRGAYDNDYRSHMMDNCLGIEVSPDGRVYAGGKNESGHAISVYLDGKLESAHIPKAEGGDKCWNWGTANKGAVSFDDNYMYSVSGCGKVHKWTRTPPYEKVKVMVDIGTPADEIVVRFNKLYLVSTSGEIQVRELDDAYTLLKSFVVEGAYDIAVEGEHSIWVSLGGGQGALNEVRRYDDEGNQLSGTLTGFGKLMGISIAYQGDLLVCDDGPSKQVLFYNITDPANPALTREFGKEGGIYNGNRGVLDHDLQFFDVQDAGTDSAGNIYTLFSTPSTIGQSGGNMVRKYAADGTKQWQLSNELWTGCASVLPSKDGQEIYGVEEVFRFDPDAVPGPTDQQWKLYAISKDDITYPDDFREINNFPSRPFRGSAEIRELEGKRVIFRHGMYSETITGDKGYDLLVFEDRPSMISHRCGQVTGSSFAWYPDTEGNVWEGKASGDQIRMHAFGGLDGGGCPQYPTYKTYDTPPFFDRVTRVYYDAALDVMYLSGYTPLSDTLPRNLAGTHLQRYDNWKAGNREARYTVELPWDQNSRNLPPKTMYVAGDYIFTVAVRPDPQGISQKITVINGITGDREGTMSARDQYGALGWVDMTRGLTAFKRSNGEYIIIVEDNGYAKNMVYRWCPDGNCKESSMAIELNHEKKKTR